MQYEEQMMCAGTQARVVCEWPNLTIGNLVTILQFDQVHGYLVKTNTNINEIWVPPHILSNGHRKPWSFKFRKSNFPSHNKRSDGAENTLTEVSCPEFQDKIEDVVAHCGTKVIFKCRVKNSGGNIKISWRKTEPDPCVMRNSGRFMLSQSDDGIAMLTINNTRPSDSGTYLCTVSNEIGSNQCSASLIVSDSLLPLSEPKIQVLSSSSILLEWESDTHNQFLVEYCKLGSGEWLSPNNHLPINSTAYTIEHLIPGETYSFRVISGHNRLVGLPSIAVTLPVADNLRWQQEQFKRRYTELQEINRGRFSVVRLAKDRGTGLEVALKQVSRRKQSHNVTQAEYSLLAGMQHANIIRSMALFDNAPLPGVDTIVLEL